MKQYPIPYIYLDQSVREKMSKNRLSYIIWSSDFLLFIINYKEFEPVKEWFKYRKANKYSWQVSIEKIKKNHYNLDIKNPHADKEEYADPKILEKEYLSLKGKNKKLLDEIKQMVEKALIN